MFGFIKRLKKLESDVAELKKRTVSQMTMEPEEKVPFSQIMDEWLNGGKEENNG